METIIKKEETRENIPTEISRPFVDEGVMEKLKENMSPNETSDATVEERAKMKESVEIKKNKIQELKEKILGIFQNPEKEDEKREINMRKGLERVRNWVNNDGIEGNIVDDLKKLKAEYPERVEPYLEALGKYQYIKWDEEKGKYVDSGKYVEPQNSLQ